MARIRRQRRARNLSQRPKAYSNDLFQIFSDKYNASDVACLAQTPREQNPKPALLQPLTDLSNTTAQILLSLSISVFAMIHRSS